jgi:hypothetical protein
MRPSRKNERTKQKNLAIGELDDNLQLLAKTMAWIQFEAQKRKMDLSQVDVMEVLRIIRDRNMEMKFGRESE